MSLPASAEPSPTPTPASDVRTATGSEPRTAFQQRFRAAFTEITEGMDLATYDEIHRRYGGDPELEIEDIKAGRHPLQRDGRDLDAYSKYAAKLAAIRANTGP